MQHFLHLTFHYRATFFRSEIWTFHYHFVYMLYINI